MSRVNVRKETECLYFDFRYMGVRCREQTTLKDTPRNRRNMEKVLEKIERAIVDGTFDYATFFPGSRRSEQFTKKQRQQASQRAEVELPAPAVEIDTPPFADFAETWFSENKIAWRVNTQKMHRCHMRKHLLPRFGHRRVHEITRAELMSFRSTLAEIESGDRIRERSPKTINEIMGTLVAILKEASLRFNFSNPGEGLKRLSVRKKDIQPLNLDEVERFLKAVRADYQPYFTVRFFTGMRSGEVHGLKWRCVDFDRREILVRETYSLGRVEYTKNDGSQREIKMSEPVYQALQKQYKATAHLGEYVFCTRTGKPLDISIVGKRVWRPTLLRLELPYRRLYQTRHTAATLWLASGEAPEWIARQMGHSSTQMLFNVYSRYVPNLTRQDGSAIERVLASRLTLNGVDTAREKGAE
ncbi:Arm DNA-binding domain-containing protein [Litorivivens sp.]|uniref:Arm DNA-binding domain-containing protein n=1 Tax=Litorivivens sp. TaxID=2020868 RepID=UPI0035677AA0